MLFNQGRYTDKLVRPFKVLKEELDIYLNKDTNNDIEYIPEFLNTSTLKE